jgi:hypothetical protein
MTVVGDESEGFLKEATPVNFKVLLQNLTGRLKKTTEVSRQDSLPSGSKSIPKSPEYEA